MAGETPHRLCALLRDLREAAGLSLAQVGARQGVSIGTLGSYERGSRMPPIPALEALLEFYGYRLVAVPVEDDAVRRPVDVAAQLRLLADQVEATTRERGRVIEPVPEGVLSVDGLPSPIVGRPDGVDWAAW